MFPAILAGLAGGVGGSLVGGIMGRSNAKQQQVASAHAYQHRYQWTMDDLRKAGLNPMLAMNQGSVGSAPSMAMANTPDVGGAISSGMQAGSAATQANTQKQLAVASAKNLEAQTLAAKSQADRNFSEANLADQNAFNTALAAERSVMENEALRKNPDAVYRSKYQGNVAREVENVFDLARNSATSFMRGTGNLFDDLKVLGSASARDLQEYKKRVQDERRN